MIRVKFSWNDLLAISISNNSGSGGGGVSGFFDLNSSCKVSSWMLLYLLVFECGCCQWAEELCAVKTAPAFKTESTIIDIQDQVIATRVIESKVMHKSVPSLMCRLFHQAEETIVHLLLTSLVCLPSSS